MDKVTFLRMVVLLGLTGIFLKIYQCNRFIKKNYEKQRVEKAIALFVKKIDELNKEIERLRYYRQISVWAIDEKRMQPCTSDRFSTLAEDTGNVS